MIFGNEVWAIRMPVFLSGIFMIPMSYFVTKIIYNKNTAIITAMFISFSSILIEYSTNARGYTLVCLFFLILLGVSQDLFKNENKYIPIFLFSIVSTLGFFTIPIMLYPFGIIFCYIVLNLVFENCYNNNEILKKLFFILIITFLSVYFYIRLFS